MHRIHRVHTENAPHIVIKMKTVMRLNIFTALKGYLLSQEKVSYQRKRIHVAEQE